VANNPPIFDRLAGLETEYAIRFHPADPHLPRPSKFSLYRALTLALRKRLLTVPARHDKDGVFTATGGSVWFEYLPPHDESGLIEGSTPECRGPRQLLTYQRAQDRLLAEAAERASHEGEFCLLKNDRDARGNVYGAQENYEAVLATGWRLIAWRAALVALLPLVVLTWIFFLLLYLAIRLYVGIATLIYLPLSPWDESRNLSRVLFGGDTADGRETGHPCAPWLCTLLNRVCAVFTLPLAGSLLVMVKCLAFHKTRRELLPFLLSRAVFTGAGMVDSDGRFHIADKAPAMNCLVGFGGFLYDRPVYSFGHFFKTIFYDACCSPRDYFELWKDRQRLQIALGDSNMADTAEYLRIGTTMLVLDCIEDGELPQLPRLRRPLASLKKVCADPSLAATIAFAGGSSATALELQRFYWEACRRFLERRADAPAEARDVLRRWGDVLERLEQDPYSLVGEVDWVTKRFLLEQAGRDCNWAAKKKIDLRYHELTDAGYFMKLKNAEHTTILIDEEAIERAMRAPPSDTPATTRGHYIREFGGGDEVVAANWKYVYLGDGPRARTIQIADYGRAGAPRPKSRKSRKQGSDAPTDG
jgi:proteasome accessory factor A